MIEYRTSVEGITVDQLAGPYFVGWPDPPDPGQITPWLQGARP